MLQYTICAFLAPALVSAAAFPWAGPEPTLIVPERDNWSPKTTEAPGLGALELLKRDDGNTCGYISGDASRSLTCSNQSNVCVTNTYFGVHGCCDPKNMSACILPTSCIPSSLLAASCTGDCSKDDYIAKCTNSKQPECYEWHYKYGTSTIMTEFGCASSAATFTVERTTIGESSSGLLSELPVSDAASSSSSITPAASFSSATATSTQSSSPEKKSTPVGAIAGGVVGGIVVLGAVVFGIIFLLRRKKSKQTAANKAAGINQTFTPGQGPAPGVTEYKPHPGEWPSPHKYPAEYYTGQQENKPWPELYGSAPTSTQYGVTGPTSVVPGVMEAGSTEVRPNQPGRIYEAPGSTPHY